MKTSALILNYLDKLHTLTVEKAKFNKAKSKPKREAWLIKVNSRWSLNAFITNSHYINKIDVNSWKIFALAPFLARLPRENISKIFWNRFLPLNLYKLLYFNNCDKICQDQIIIGDCIVQIQRATWLYQEESNIGSFYQKLYSIEWPQKLQYLNQPLAIPLLWYSSTSTAKSLKLPRFIDVKKGFYCYCASFTPKLSKASLLSLPGRKFWPNSMTFSATQ